MVVMIPSNTIQFQYFEDFSKCLHAIFSQLSFENFWLHLLGEVVDSRLLKWSSTTTDLS